MERFKNCGEHELLCPEQDPAGGCKRPGPQGQRHGLRPEARGAVTFPGIQLSVSGCSTWRAKQCPTGVTHAADPGLSSVSGTSTEDDARGKARPPHTPTPGKDLPQQQAWQPCLSNSLSHQRTGTEKAGRKRREEMKGKRTLKT